MAHSADVVFLIDATASMDPVIQGLKNNIKAFFKQITTAAGQNVPPIRDWRAKVVAFRDATCDDVWFEDMPFTRDVPTLEETLDKLEDKGGGDIPESLLDAIYTLANMPETESQDEPEPDKWRYRYGTARYIIAFTDAGYKEPMAATSPIDCEGMMLDDVVTAVENAKIRLALVHPATSADENDNPISIIEDFKVLANARNAVDMPTVDEKGNEIPLDEFAKSEKFNDLIALLAKTVTKMTAEIPIA